MDNKRGFVWSFVEQMDNKVEAMQQIKSSACSHHLLQETWQLENLIQPQHFGGYINKDYRF